MIPSPEDPSWMSDGYQSDLRNLGRTLRADGLEIQDVGARSGCADAISGEWKVKLGAALGPVLGVPLGSWLEARHGRAVRLKIGEIEADVRTVDEFVSVLKIATFYQEAVESDS